MPFCKPLLTRKNCAWPWTLNLIRLPVPLLGRMPTDAPTLPVQILPSLIQTEDPPAPEEPRRVRHPMLGRSPFVPSVRLNTTWNKFIRIRASPLLLRPLSMGSLITWHRGSNWEFKKTRTSFSDSSLMPCKGAAPRYARQAKIPSTPFSSFVAR